MSEFRDYSLPELYGNTGGGPQNPAQINWSTMALYSGIALTSVVLFAVIITQANKNQMKLWVEHSEKLNQSHIAALEKQSALIKSLIQEPK